MRAVEQLGAVIRMALSSEDVTPTETPTSRSRALWARGVTRLVAGLWFVVIPALLAGIMCRFAVPRLGEFPADTLGGRFAELDDARPVELRVAVFFVLSLLMRAWGRFLPGGALLVHHRKVRSRLSELLAWTAALLVAVGGVWTLRSVVRPLRVTSSSMVPTFETGDRVLASLGAYRSGSGVPKRGDVIVFDGARVGLGAQSVVKRAIGLPGDRITMQGGHPVINDWPVPSCDAGLYVRPDRHTHVQARLVVEFLEEGSFLTVHTPFFRLFTDTYVVKPGELFVLGDNRNNSSDSRAWNEGHGGGLPIDAVFGQVRQLLLPTHPPAQSRLAGLFAPLPLAISLPGTDWRGLNDAIRKCIDGRPAETHPPDAKMGRAMDDLGAPSERHVSASSSP